MRGIALFNLFYGTAGYISSFSILNHHGMLLSLYVMTLGAMAHVGLNLGIRDRIARWMSRR